MSLADNPSTPLSLAELQTYLKIGMVNPQPPDVDIGTTAFCTFRNFDELSRDKFMWVALQGKDKDLGNNIQYQINVEGEGMIWVDAKYVWTKQQVERLAGVPVSGPAAYLPPWERDFVLPEGVEIKDPQAFMQAALNMMRDAIVMGRRGSTNLAAVKCDVDGLCLGHFYKMGDALGTDVCLLLNAKKLNNS